MTGLPDQHGRLQILNIHTETMRTHKKLAPDVDLTELAAQTKNFSGAEIEGLVRAAQSTAMNRLIKVRKLEELRKTLACVCVCARACLCACLHACVRACVCVCDTFCVLCGRGGEMICCQCHRQDVTGPRYMSHVAC